MEHRTSSEGLVLETLLKTNRPPTDEEKAIIYESMSPINAKLKSVEEEISDTISHIQDLKLQVEQAETKLLQLREKKATIWETSKDHRHVLSAVRDLPEDVLRDICIAYVADSIPTLSSDQIPLPYVLAHLCSGMRRIILTTPVIWACMHVAPDFRSDRLAYSILARRASDWFERARGLPLILYISDSTSSQTWPEDSKSEDPSDILLDALISYSARWKEIRLISNCHYLSRPMARIAKLTAIDLPLLESVAHNLEYSASQSELPYTGFLMIPTLKRVALRSDSLRKLAVHWAALTYLSLSSKSDSYCYSMNEVARILQQTKHLINCIISASYRSHGELYLVKIKLPFLEFLCITDRTRFGPPAPPSSGTPSLIDLITAPALRIFRCYPIDYKCSWSRFFQRSPKIWKLSLSYSPQDRSLSKIARLLCHCSSLTALSLRPPSQVQGTQPPKTDSDKFLQAFVVKSSIGIICPRLRYISIRGDVTFSLSTLQLFLNRKHGEPAIPGISPWKRVIINIRGMEETEEYQQMLDFVSEKKAQGLNVDALPRDEDFPEYNYFDE